LTVAREGIALGDLMAARLKAARAAAAPLTAELARAQEELAEARVIRGHLAQHPERFSAPEREAVLERSEELATRCRELALDIESARATVALLEELGGAVAEVVVAERMRIARDLHDGPLQALSNLVLEAEVLERLVERDPQRAAAELQQFRSTVRDAITDMRGVLAGMRPPSVEELGLAIAVRRLASDWQARTGAGCQVKIAGEGRRLPPEIEEALFWIVAEALTNIERHAQARRVAVDLDLRGESAGVRVRDDGQGFDVAAAAAPGDVPRLGLLGMRERALAAGGTLEVRSRPGSGTFIEVELPINIRASS
jgi:two-component system sensor histidine kinase DegS